MSEELAPQPSPVSIEEAIRIYRGRGRNQLPPSVRFRILRRDSYTCQYCGASAPWAQLEVDHIIPVTLGGTDDEANLQVACRDCNIGKFTSSSWVVKSEILWDLEDYSTAMHHYAEWIRKSYQMLQRMQSLAAERYGKAPDIPKLLTEVGAHR